MTDTPEPETVTQQAIAWAVRVGDPAFDDWDVFEAWLAVSPDHADAYHAVVLDEADMVAAIAAEPRTIDEPVAAPASRVRRVAPWAGFGLAAALVGAVVLQMRTAAPAPVTYATAPGEQRVVALADGSSVRLNGGTRILADRNDPRTLTLVSGEALFTVKHHDAAPFRVVVGNAHVVDVGTRFDIVHDGGTTRVMVAEGAVDWRRGDNAVRLPAGKRLHAQDGSSDVEIGVVEPVTVGGWSQDQLSYDAVALAEVAGDLARTLGTRIVVAPAIARRSVRTVIRLDGGAKAVVPRLAALVGVRAQWDGEQWRLTG